MKTLMQSFVSIILVCFSVSVFANEEISIDVHSADRIQINTVERHYYNFGSVLLNSAQYIRYVMTNTGTTNLTFKSATIGGAGFDASHSCTGGLKPQEKCSFTIRFSPFFEGYNSGRFILSFVEDDDIVVDLSGQGSRI